MRKFTASMRLRLLASTIAALGSQTAMAQTIPLPSGGTVKAGSATIEQQGSGVAIRQTSGRAVIDWKNFSIGAGGRVDVLQPGSTSALLNRVTGNDVSHIAGTLSSNGQVFLVNRNGILIDQDGRVETRGGFVASTLDISDDDFMSGNLRFSGGGVGVIANRGRIEGGAVALLGSRVANFGTIVSPMGRVAIGAAQQATLDLNGDGFLQVAIPSMLDGADGSPLIDQRGVIDVGGGLVVMRAATAREIVRQTINMSGIVRATSVSRDGGTVVLDGGDGGTVSVSGSVDASGVRGGRVDVTGGDVALTGATIAATGSERGGLVRVGGAFQGGAATMATTPAVADKFTTRFGPVSTLQAARTTTIDAGSTIDVSGAAVGGTAVVWSNDRTRQAGIVNATGAVGGAVEFSSKGSLVTDLSRVTAGRGGSLLLDPKNISVYDAFSFPSSSPDPLTGGVGYGDNPGSDATFSVADIKRLMDGGTDVFLRASNDINWGADLNVSFDADVGDLALSAGRSVSIAGSITLNQANLSVVANDTLANGVIDADRDAGAAEISTFNALISGGIASGWTGGHVSLTMGSGAGVTNGQAGGMRIASIAARSIAIDAGANRVSIFGVGGGINPTFLRAVDGLTFTGAIRSQSGDLTFSGRTVNWTNEASAALTATVPDSLIRFVEDGVLTRFGLLRGGESGGAAATRLALGKGASGIDYTSVYGDAYAVFDGLRLVSGNLLGSDTLETILASGAITAVGPAAGQGVGDYAVTTSANAGFALASGVSGYFVDVRGVSDTLRITPKTLTATASAAAYTYGSPTTVATLSGLVGSDSAGLTATVAGLGTQSLIGGTSGYSFAANLAAGQRDFTLTGLSGTAAANYTLDLSGTVGATLAIARKSLTYAGLTTSSVYGTLNSAAFGLSGILFSDDVSIGVAGLTRNGVTSALTTTTSVGTYATVAGSLTGTAAGNYVVDTAGSSAGVAIIDPKTLTYTTNNVNSTYGTLAALGAPTLSGVVAGDDVGASASLFNGPVALDARTAAGTYGITAALTGAGAGNYVLAAQGNAIGALTIARLGLSYSVADASQVYSTPVSLATVSGFLVGDDVYATGTLDSSSEGMTALPNGGVGFSLPDAGTHSFLLTGIAGSAASNYTLNLSGARTATLTVTPKPINYTVSSLTTQYASFQTPTLSILENSRFPLTGSVIATNVATGASVTLDVNSRLPVGNYVLTAGNLSGANAFNYTVAAGTGQPGTMVVTPKPITYSALSSTSQYGNLATTPGVVLNGTFSADSVFANFSILSGSTAITLTDRTSVGTYRVAVTGIGGSDAGNYTLTGGTEGSVTINPLVFGFRLSDGVATYGTLATPSYTLFGILPGDSVAPIFFARGAELTDRLNAGTHTAELVGLGGPQGGNYIRSPDSNPFTNVIVHAAPLTFSLAAGTSVYGNSLRFAPLVWSGLKFDDLAPSATVRLADSQFFSNVNAGTYTPDVLANVFGNYYLDRTNSSIGQYVITRRAIGLESFANAGAFGTSYGLRPDQVTGLVRASNYLDGTLNAFTATPQNLTLSTGGYVNAGSYVLKVNAAVGDLFATNYVIGSITQGQFTITPRELGISSFGTVNSVYGSQATLASRAVTPFQGDLVALSGLSLALGSQAVALGAQTPAGSYNIVAAGLTGADAANYTRPSSGDVGTLIVAPKPLIFNTGNLNATYGTLESLGMASLSGIVGSDQVSAINSINGGYDARTSVGTRQFNAPTLVGASASNYSVNTAGSFGSYYGYLNIAPRALSVTYQSGAPTSWTFGTTSPNAARFYTLGGILDGDTVSADPYAVLTATAAGNPLTLGTFYGLAEQLNAGTYRASAFGTSGFGVLSGSSAGNYILAPGSATNAAPSFNVTPHTINGSLTVPAAITYGDAPAITVGFTGTVANATPAYRVNASLGTTNRDLGAATALPANLAAGTQALSVLLTGLNSFNYSLGAPVVGQVSISPKSVSIDQLLYSVTYGLASGAAFGINGLIAGDDVAPMVSVGGATAVRATTLDGGFGLPLVTRDVGYYATSIGVLTGGAAGNYLLASFDGNLSITPKTITYTSDGFAAQYGGLTLPTCASGCETSGRDNNLAYGAVTLNGVLAQDLGNLIPRIYLSLDGRSGASNYVRTTAAGNYLQIVNSLDGSKAGNYVLAQDGSKAGLVIILPAWVKATVTGGGRLYTNKLTGTYVSLGTPGIVTLNRSDNLSVAQAGNSFYPGDRVNVVTKLVDAKGFIVDGASILPVGTYTINPLALVGPEAANYRLVPEGGSNGSVAGIFTVSDSSVFNFSFLTSSPNGYYIPPAISNPPIAPIAPITASTTTTTTTSSTLATATTNYVTGSAGAGATGGTNTTQTYADGSSLTAAASGAVGATAGYTPLSATATVAASANVSLLINRGPVTINYGAFVDASGKVEVSLTSLTITAGGEVMAGVQQGFNVGGNLGSGMSGSTEVQAQGFATANGEATASLSNGLNVGTSGFIGVGASIGVDGSLSGGGVTGSIGATLYSPGSLYIGAKVESGYADHTLTLGFNIGISLLIGGIELSPKISFSTEKIEAAGEDFANAWLGLGEKMLGVYCDSACTAARNQIQADYDAQVKANVLGDKVLAATNLMYSAQKPSLNMIQYLQANPDVVHFAQEALANGQTTPGTNAITSAIANYQYLTDYLASVVSQEKELSARLAANPTSISAADLVQANYLRTQEKAVIDAAAAMFNMRVVVSNGQLTFG